MSQEKYDFAEEIMKGMSGILTYTPSFDGYTGISYPSGKIYETSYSFSNAKKNVPEIKRIIFQPESKVTVVLWEDGTKTIVKCTNGDEFVPETGVAEAISEKFYGSRNKFLKAVKKAMKEYEESKQYKENKK